MKLIHLTISQVLVLAVVVCAGFLLTQVLHHTVAQRAVRFAIFIPAVIALLVIFFRFADPLRPFDLALTLAVIMDAVTAAIIIVKDFAIDGNITPRVALVLLVVSAAPFLAASIHCLVATIHRHS